LLFWTEEFLSIGLIEHILKNSHSTLNVIVCDAPPLAIGFFALSFNCGLEIPLRDIPPE